MWVYSAVAAPCQFLLLLFLLLLPQELHAKYETLSF
jgi:hypothetical protein